MPIEQAFQSKGCLQQTHALAGLGSRWHHAGLCLLPLGSHLIRPSVSAPIGLQVMPAFLGPQPPKFLVLASLDSLWQLKRSWQAVGQRFASGLTNDLMLWSVAPQIPIWKSQKVFKVIEISTWRQHCLSLGSVPCHYTYTCLLLAHPLPDAFWTSGGWKLGPRWVGSHRVSEAGR